ncbi:RNase H domain-containing protein [Trichonephila clavipes]|nr:RNase H domain-containing protein [Trichonephila clavipes]
MIWYDSEQEIIFPSCVPHQGIEADFHSCIPEIHVYCNASVTNLQKLEKAQLSAARIITGLRNACPRDIALFEADLQPLSLRRRTCLTKYYNKLRSLDSRNRTSAYFKDLCNNQRLRRNSPFCQMVYFTLTIGAVEPHLLSQCLDPGDDLDGVFFHRELPVHVNKQIDLPAFLKQLALEIIGDITIDAIQVYMDGSRDDYYRSGSGIYIKSQDQILRIQRRNPDGCSVFRSELIAINESLGSLTSLPNGKEIWILSDSRSAIQHLSNWQSLILSHIDLEENEIADILTKVGACEVPEPSAPLTFLVIFSRTKLQNKIASFNPPEHHWYQCSRPGGSMAHGVTSRIELF